MKKILIAILLLFSLSSLFALSDKEEIENALTVYQNAFNTRDKEKFKSVVMNPENVDSAFSLLELPYMTQYNFQVEITVLNIEIEGAKASVETYLKFTMDLGDMEYMRELLPISEGSLITYTFIKYHDKWLLVN